MQNNPHCFFQPVRTKIPEMKKTSPAFSKGRFCGCFQHMLITLFGLAEPV